MTWLSAIIKGLFSAFLSWWQRQAEKPQETQNANTPKAIRSQWNDYITGKLRDKEGRSDRPKQ